MCCKHANIFKLSLVLIFCTVGRVRNIISRFLFNLLYTITYKIFKKYKILCYVLHILDLLMVYVLFFVWLHWNINHTYDLFSTVLYDLYLQNQVTHFIFMYCFFTLPSSNKISFRLGHICKYIYSFQIL